MLISYRIVSVEDLYSEVNLDLTQQFNLPDLTMNSFEQQVQSVVNSNKPVVIVNTVFYLHQEDLESGQFTQFIIHETPEIIIASNVSAGDDGYKIAATAVRYEMFLPPRGTY